jgi:hypothetical protein
MARYQPRKIVGNLLADEEHFFELGITLICRDQCCLDKRKRSDNHGDIAHEFGELAKKFGRDGW